MTDRNHNPEAAVSILVVDDEEPIRDSVRRILVKEGYDVRVAENGKLRQPRPQP